VASEIPVFFGFVEYDGDPIGFRLLFVFLDREEPNQLCISTFIVDSRTHVTLICARFHRNRSSWTPLRFLISSFP
jgi:hypothetical protein